MSRPSRRFDAVVVGCGIVGASTVRELAALGMRNTLLIERWTVAAGASGRTGAILRRHYSNRAEARLAQLGYLTYRCWNDRIGGDCGFVPQGVVVTVNTSLEHVANIDKLRKNVAMLQSLGVDTVALTGDELRELQPALSTDDLALVAYEPESGYVDSVAATRAMAQSALREGVTIEEHTAATAIRTTGGRVDGLDTSRGPVSADIVVCAAGPWSPRLLATAGLELRVEALRVQIAIIQRPLTLPTDHLVLVDTAAGVFARPWGPGRTLVGVAGGDQHDSVDPDRYEIRNDPGYPARALEAIQKRFPAMEQGAYLHGHACLYDMSPDAHPIIGATDVEGLYVAAGFSGAGFKKGPAVGRCLAELILSGVSHSADLSPFSPARFDSDEWRKPWSDTEYTYSSDFGHGL